MNPPRISLSRLPALPMFSATATIVFSTESAPGSARRPVGSGPPAVPGSGLHGLLQHAANPIAQLNPLLLRCLGLVPEEVVPRPGLATVHSTTVSGRSTQSIRPV